MASGAKLKRLNIQIHHKETKMRIKRAFAAASVSAVALLTTVFAVSLPDPEKQVVGSGQRADGYRLTIAASNDGTGTDGQAILVDTETNSRLKIDIVGIGIRSTDRIARLVGTVANGTGVYNQIEIGTVVEFFVEDEGEGAGSIPDGFSLPQGGRLPAEMGYKRTDGGSYPPIVNGNFRVTGERDEGEVIVVPK